MLSIKNLIDMFSEMSDTELICTYLLQDEVFDESVKLLTDVCQRKIRGQTDYINRTQGWLRLPNAFYYEKYGTEIGRELDYITRKMQIGEELNESDDEYLQKIVPTIPIATKGNRMFWGELYDYIHSTLKLKFKDEE